MAFVSPLSLRVQSHKHSSLSRTPSSYPYRSCRSTSPSCPRRSTIRAHAGCSEHQHHDVNTCDADAVVGLVKFNENGLVPVIAQQWDTNEVLMMAWMNEEALRITVNEQRAVYYSRSRGKLWRKGESSGNTQALHDLRVDCDGDTILVLVDQLGPACHTGRRSCFYFKVRDGAVEHTSEPMMTPEEMYGPNAKK